MLAQSKLDPAWWPEAAQTFCFLRVAQDMLHPDNKTAYERRWGYDFHGPRIPFGAEVHFRPSSKSDLCMVHPMGSKTVCGFFAGYHQQEWGIGLEMCTCAQ